MKPRFPQRDGKEEQQPHNEHHISPLKGRKINGGLAGKGVEGGRSDHRAEKQDHTEGRYRSLATFPQRHHRRPRHRKDQKQRLQKRRDLPQEDHTAQQRRDGDQRDDHRRKSRRGHLNPVILTEKVNHRLKKTEEKKSAEIFAFQIQPHFSREQKQIHQKKGQAEAKRQQNGGRNDLQRHLGKKKAEAENETGEKRRRHGFFLRVQRHIRTPFRRIFTESAAD